MRILLATPASTKRRVASMPSTPGMRMSINTTSGRSVRTASIAADPSPASPTTSRSGCASRIIRKPARTSAWSSTIRTLIMPPPCPPPEGEGVLAGIEGQAGVDGEAAGGIAPRAQLTTEERDPFAHPDQSMSGRRRRIGAVAGTVIADVDGEHGFRVVHPDVDAAGAGVLEHVGGCLLHDSIGRQVDPRRQRPRLALHSRIDLEPRGAQLLDQARQLTDAGLWAAIGGGAVASAQHAEQPVQLDQGLARGRFDQAEGLRGCGGAGVLHGTRGSGLDRNHADIVRDHVMELA